MGIIVWAFFINTKGCVNVLGVGGSGRGWVSSRFLRGGFGGGSIVSCLCRIFCEGRVAF
jgi:hypothetical protein